MECRFADNADAAQVLFGFSDDIQGVAFVPNGLSILVADGTNDHTSIRRVMLAGSTLNPQPSTLNPQPSTLNPQPSTLNP